MQIFPKGTPRAAPLAMAVAVEERQREETGSKKSRASASAASSSKQEESSAKKKEVKRTRSNDKDHRATERREDQSSSSKGQENESSSSRRSDRKPRRHGDKEKKKRKKKKERIPIIERVPTAMDYDSDDTLERMIRQRSRYSRYMTEYDVKPDNFENDDDADDGDEEDIIKDKYNGIAHLMSDSDDSDHAEWRESWDENEETTANRKSQFDRDVERVIANEDDISAMLQERKRSGPQRKYDASRGASSRRALDEGLSPYPGMDDKNWEHIEPSNSRGAIEAVLDPLKANAWAEDMDRIIHASASDTSSLTDPLKREEMLIAARIRAANENEYMTHDEVPRLLSLTKKRSKAQSDTSTGMDSPKSSSKGPSSTASPPPKEAQDSSTTNALASKSKRDPTETVDNTKGKETSKTAEQSDKIPKVDTLPTVSSGGQSSVSKSNKPLTAKEKHPAQPEGTDATAEASVEAVPKAENADAPAGEEPKQSKRSFFSRVPLFRSLSRSRSRSRSLEKRSSTPTGRKERHTPEPEPKGDNGEAEKEKAATKQKPDKYTPTVKEEKTFIDEAAPTPQGDNEKGSSSGDKAVSSGGDVNATSNNDVKPSNHLDGNAIPASTNGKPNETETSEPQEKRPEEVDNLLTVTLRDKQGPAWSDIENEEMRNTNMADTEAERNIMYTRSLVNDSNSGESSMGRLLSGNRVKGRNFVHKARKAKKAQMMELDEYSFAVSVDDDPDLVQCLRFYYCGAVANVFGVAISATDCTKTKKQIKGSEVKTGILSSVDEVDEVEAQRWRDDNATQYSKVEVTLEELKRKSKPVDHVAFDQKHRKKHPSKGRTPSGRKQDYEASDDETADLEIGRQISRVQEVTSMHFSLDEDSEKKRKHEAMLQARRMAAKPIKEIPMTSIRIPSQLVATNRELNPAAEERGGRDEGEGRIESAAFTDNDQSDDEDRVKTVDDDVTMATNTGSSEESARSGTEQPAPTSQQKKKGLTRFLPRIGRKATKEEAN